MNFFFLFFQRQLWTLVADYQTGKTKKEEMKKKEIPAFILLFSSFKTNDLAIYDIKVLNTYIPFRGAPALRVD